MERYCDTYVFKKYLFYKKAGRKEYEVECSYCGHRYTSAQAPRHKHEGKCPKCRCQALYFRRQYITSIYEKDELCVARKHGNLTLISWVNLYRDFRGGSPAYQYYDRFRNVVEADEGKKTVYAYFMREGRGYYGYYNHGWFRMKNGEIGSSDAYIYKPGAKYLVPALWEGFDLVEHLCNPRQRTNLEALLYNLKQYPQTEYLLKMGLHEFVNGWGLGHFICGGKGFGGALGIRPQYLPLYKAYKPTRREHELIRKSEQWISEELFLKIRAHPEITYEKLEKALEYTSLEKLVNYLFKQYEHYAHSIKCFEFTQLLTWFRDYFDMARKVNIDLSRKSRLMPRDLKFSHDRLSVRISEARRRQKEEEDVRIEALRDEERQKAEQERLEKQERNREAFQVVKERIYTKIPEYRNSEYIVVLPQCEEDFIAEGDSLGHCVGNGTYYSNHVKMNTMVFFIRRANRPDRPYITLSVNMSSCTKGELYGYGDHAVTTAVKDFVNGFLKAMKQSLKIKDPPPEKKKQVVTHREDRVVNMPRAA